MQMRKEEEQKEGLKRNKGRNWERKGGSEEEGINKEELREREDFEEKREKEGRDERPHGLMTQKEALTRAGLQAALLSGFEIPDCDFTLLKLEPNSVMSDFAVNTFWVGVGAGLLVLHPGPCAREVLLSFYVLHHFLNYKPSESRL